MPRLARLALLGSAGLSACGDEPPTCVEVVADVETWETERILALDDGYAVIGGKSLAVYDLDPKQTWKIDDVMSVLDFALIDGELVAVTREGGTPRLRRWSLDGEVLANDAVGVEIDANAAVIASDGVAYLHARDGDHGVWTSVGTGGESEVHIDDGWSRGDGFSTSDGDLIVLGYATTAHDISVRRLSPEGTEQWGFFPQHEGELEIAGLYPDREDGAYVWLVRPAGLEGGFSEERLVRLGPDGRVAWDIEVENGSEARQVAAAGARVVSVRRTHQATTSDVLVLDASTGESLCTTTIETDPSGLFDALVYDDVVNVINHDGWVQARLLD